MISGRRPHANAASSEAAIARSSARQYYFNLRGCRCRITMTLRVQARHIGERELRKEERMRPGHKTSIERNLDPTYDEYPGRTGRHAYACPALARSCGTLVGSQLQDSATPGRLQVGEAIELFSAPRTRNGQYLRPAARPRQLSGYLAASRTG
jgi:hypothetical protein